MSVVAVDRSCTYRLVRRTLYRIEYVLALHTSEVIQCEKLNITTPDSHQKKRTVR